MTTDDKIKQYLKDMLEWLDGQGLVLTDDELIDAAIDELGEHEFIYLKKIIKSSD